MRWLAFLVVSLALVAAGCGGGSNESAASTETTTTDTSMSESTDTSTSDSTGTSDLSGILDDEDCVALAGIGATFAQAVTGASDEQASEELQKLVDKVPGEIKPDVQVLAEWFTQYTAKLKDIGIKAGQAPTAAQVQELQAALSSANANQQELTKASQHIETWAQSNCTG